MAVSGDATMSHPTATSARNHSNRTSPAGAAGQATRGVAIPRARHVALSAALGATLCLASASSWARPPWLCSLTDEATRLVCVVDLDPAVELGAAPDTSVGTARALPAAAPSGAGTSTSARSAAGTAAVSPTTAITTTPEPGTTPVVNGTAFPLDTARVYTVDLFAPATEREWVEQLARATICYRSPGCDVIVVGMDDPANAAVALRSGAAIARLSRAGN
jgi:hypothetical protein